MIMFHLVIYIDTILLIILLLLILLTCGYCIYRVYRMQQSGQAILLRPTKVVFSHKNEGDSEAHLRTVVAYQNPFTGDYCVHKNREPKVYVNSLESNDSADSGVSDEYEPLHPVPPPTLPTIQQQKESKVSEPVHCPRTPLYDNSLNKTWKWDYTEYQI